VQLVCELVCISVHYRYQTSRLFHIFLFLLNFKAVTRAAMKSLLLTSDQSLRLELSGKKARLVVTQYGVEKTFAA
jgi:hypothetical protein